MIDGREGFELGWLRRMSLEAALGALESKLARATEEVPALRAVAAEKIEQGAPLTQREAAAFLNTTTKQILRLETRGRLRRCPALDGLVRYTPRGVRKLASAPGEGA